MFCYEEKTCYKKWQRLYCEECGYGRDLLSNGKKVKCSFCALEKKTFLNKCNRHKDCNAAREKAKAEGKNPLIICCHDEGCEECFGY